MTGTITVRALASLASFAPPGGTLSISPGETAGQVAGRLGIPWAAVGAVLCNGRPAEPGTPLAPGDVLSLVPPIGGG